MQNCKIKKHYKAKYTQIDNILVNDMGLSFQAKGLFLYIWSKPNDWQVNVKAMQYHCIDKQTKIYSALKELETRGYLIRKRYYENGKVAGINYNFSDTKEFFFDQDELNQENLNQVELNEENQNEYIDIQKKDNTKERYIQKKDNTNTASGFSNKKEIPIISISETVQPTVKKSLTVESVEVVEINGKSNIDLFEAFWEKYPKKKAKEKARQIFEKLLSKAKNKEILVEKIMQGIELYNQDIQQKQTKEEFIAHATTWLNQARWEDEYEVIKPEYYKGQQQQPQSKRQRVNYNNLQPLEFQELKID